MQLNSSNYFSAEAMQTYMSTSQFKQFDACQSSAVAILNGQYDDEIEAFIEGLYFETIICGHREQFEEEYAERILSGRGATKGEPKANYRAVVASANAFLRQPAFIDILARCEQQTILTGLIAGVPFKCKIDFFDRSTLSEWDAKCMRNFQKVYNEREGHYEAWYFERGYHYQAAIERELIRQNFGGSGQFGLIAASKEPVPNVSWLVFADEVMDNAIEIVKEFAPKYAAIKRCDRAPEPCGICDYCKQTIILTEPREIIEYE